MKEMQPHQSLFVCVHSNTSLVYSKNICTELGVLGCAGHRYRLIDRPTFYKIWHFILLARENTPPFSITKQEDYGSSTDYGPCTRGRIKETHCAFVASNSFSFFEYTREDFMDGNVQRLRTPAQCPSLFCRARNKPNLP